MTFKMIKSTAIDICNQKGEKVNARMMVKVVVALIVVLAVSLVAIGCGEDSPSAAVEDFIEATKDGNCDKAVDMLDLDVPGMEEAGLSTDDLKKEIVASCEADVENSEIVSYEVRNEEIDGDTATVEVEMTTKVDDEESTETDTLTLNKRDGEWKISFGV
jgi:hypothetical protein